MFKARFFSPIDMSIFESFNGIGTGIFLSDFISPDRIGGDTGFIFGHWDAFFFTSSGMVLGAFFKHLVGTFLGGGPRFIIGQLFFHGRLADFTQLVMGFIFLDKSIFRGLAVRVLALEGPEDHFIFSKILSSVLGFQKLHFRI